MEKILDIIIIDTLKFLMSIIFYILAPAFVFTKKFICFVYLHRKEIDENTIIIYGRDKDSIIPYFKAAVLSLVLQFIAYYFYYIMYVYKTDIIKITDIIGFVFMVLQCGFVLFILENPNDEDYKIVEND